MVPPVPAIAPPELLVPLPVDAGAPPDDDAPGIVDAAAPPLDEKPGVDAGAPPLDDVPPVVLAQLNEKQPVLTVPPFAGPENEPLPMVLPHKGGRHGPGCGFGTGLGTGLGAGGGCTPVSVAKSQVQDWKPANPK